MIDFYWLFIFIDGFEVGKYHISQWHLAIFSFWSGQIFDYSTIDTFWNECQQQKLFFRNIDIKVTVVRSKRAFICMHLQARWYKIDLLLPLILTSYLKLSYIINLLDWMKFFLKTPTNLQKLISQKSSQKFSANI